MKALKFLKEQQRRHINMAESMKVAYFDDELDEAIEELEKLENITCDGCNHLETQTKVLQYSCMPEPCRSCERKASDRYESKDKQ